ncbi:MAG: alpha/beta fold hydrolase [Gammaproteobacteria bacterium]|nr:alpha/beta fold hydrolase [Gammaproteobacteria bacterium]
MVATDKRLPVILIPGLLNTDDLWRDQVTGLSALGDVSVTNEHRNFDSMTAIAAAILEQAPTKFALAGLSMGGYVSFEMLRQAPERVTKLALLDTSARPDTPEKAAQRRETIRIAGESGLKRVLETMQPNLLHPKHANDPAIVTRLARMAARVGVDGFARQQTAIMNRADSRPLLPEIRCSTLVLCGREDALTPPEVAGEMVDKIPNSRLVIIEECGHLSAIEQPEQVTAAMRAWLKGG